MIFSGKLFNKEITLSSSPPVSRASLVWLFIVQIFILVPHFIEVPPWLAVLWLFVVFWRWKIFQGAWSYPTKVQKTIVVFLCSAGLVVSLGIGFSLVSMVSLLLAGFVLKLLEMKNRKDFVLLVYVAFFILATQFIFFNHVMAAFYGFFCLVLLGTLLLQLYQNPHVQKPPVGKFKTLKGALKTLNPSLFILLQAIPLMLMLFVVVPRLGSFWAVPSPPQVKTGMSDSMSPGDISQLIQSNELAFRVTFDGEVPGHEKLYWRGLVFAYFDGRRWSSPYQSRHKQDLRLSSQPIYGWREKISYLGEKTSYDVVAEPSNQPWLYLLAAPEVWSNDLLLGHDLHLESALPVTRRISYNIRSALNYRLDAGELDSLIMTQNLQIPARGNAETQRIAKEWISQVGDTEALISKLFAYFHDNFYYTLQPPALGSDSVDEFLWQSRQGFCEHFASGFVFFMRAAGIPARVVVGYQGGELNTVENYLTVRQRDAHAWAEVWIRDRGWVLYDPTSAVAPERIRRGIVDSLNAQDQKLLSRHFGGSFKFLLSLRNQWEALNFQWIRWVMNYDSSVQSELLRKILVNVDPLRIALLVLAAGGASVLIVFTFLFLRRNIRRLPLVERSGRAAYAILCKKLATCGFVLVPGEAPRHFMLRAANLRPDLAPSLNKIMDLYEQLVYGENLSVLVDLKYELANFSPKRNPPSAA